MVVFIIGVVALVIEAVFKCNNIPFVVLTVIVAMTGYINMIAYLLKRDICDMIECVKLNDEKLLFKHYMTCMTAEYGKKK